MSEQINKVPVDRFTMAHMGVGMILGALQIRERYAIGIAVGWELLEIPLKKKIPAMFPHSSQDIPANAVIDAFSMYAGYKIVTLLFRRTQNGS